MRRTPNAATRETATFWRAEEFDGLELLRARYVQHSFAPHTHETYVVGVISYGIDQFRRNKQLCAAPAGSIVLVNPGEMHTGQAGDERGWAYRAFYPSPKIMQRAATLIADKPQAAPYFSQAVVRDDYVSGLMRTLHESLEGGASLFERESQFVWAMSQLILRHASERPVPKHNTDRKALQRAREFLDHHCWQNISLNQLAGQVHLSPFHFLRVFKEAYGLPPHAVSHSNPRAARQAIALGGQPHCAGGARCGLCRSKPP
ncbi:MAG: AraC family transcriptional regulator [Anaerolineae bacterium]|nr:AraC family transcriptional regulator [Anaerolineae bacterium]